MGESLAWGSPRPSPVIIIIFIVERCVCAEGGLSSLCKAQPSLQVIYLSLQGSFIIPVSGTYDYPQGYVFCWFMSCLHSLPETFHFLHSGHAQGLGSYPAAGIQLAQADGGLLCGGPIPPCSIIILTSTRVLPTDNANYRVLIWGVLHCRCERTQTQQAQYNEFGKEMDSRTGL